MMVGGERYGICAVCRASGYVYAQTPHCSTKGIDLMECVKECPSFVKSNMDGV